jgi:hypothetical protein
MLTPEQAHEILGSPLNVGSASDLLKAIFFDAFDGTLILGIFVAQLCFLQQHFTRIVHSKIQLATRLKIKRITNLFWNGDLPLNRQSGCHGCLFITLKIK